MKIPVVGGSYQGLGAIIDLERSINLLVEQPPRSSGALNNPYTQTPGALIGTPGYSVFARLPGAPVRALFEQDGRCFTVVGAYLFELFASGTFNTIGPVAVDSNPATICSNGQAGFQLFIVSGGHGYIFDLNLGTLTDVSTQSEFPFPALCGWFTDGYFGALQQNSITFALSNLENGLIWDINQGGKAQISEASDNIQNAVVSHREIWFTGSKTTEIWSDIGTADFPYAPIPGTLIERGIDGPYTLCSIDNTVMCVSKNQDGSRDVVRANGYAFQVVSNPGIANLLSLAPSMQGAIAWPYVQNGHGYFLLSIPDMLTDYGVTSPVYDVSNNTWHERGLYMPDADQFVLDLGRCHAYAFDQHLVGDRQSGTIYTMGFSQQAMDVVLT
jgi:hypothetical protein